MKKVFVIVSLLFGSISYAGETIEVGVNGMVCAFCAQGIEKNFKAQPEVSNIKVSLENKKIAITYKDGKKLSDDKITQILKDAGYEAVFKENHEHHQK